jgi:hypothetical protein
MDQIRKIKTFIGNVLWTEEEKRDRLLNGEDFVGCKHGNIVLYKENGQIKSVDAHQIPVDMFINVASIAGNIDNLSSYICKFSELAKYTNYSFVSLNQGDNICIDAPNPSNIFAFTATHKVGQYFDFVMYNNTKTLNTLTYNNRTMSGYTHSGDILKEGYLLQYINNISNANKNVCTLGVVGYCLTELSKFENQNPSIVIIDEKSEILYVVPCPLDKATMARHTFASLATVKRTDGKINISVLRMPIGIDKVNTGAIGAEVKESVISAISEHTESSMSVTTVAVREINRIDTDVDLPQILHFVQKGTEYTHDTPCFVFGRGLEWVDNYIQIDHDAVTLSPFGILRGPSVISLLQSYHGSIDMDEVTFLCAIDECKSIIIHINDKWIESVVKINDVLINGCIVIHVNLGLDNVETCMNKLCIAGVSAIAGPLAMVIVSIADKYYWYRGIPNYGITTLPEFGEDITDKINFEISNDWPNVFYRDEQMLVWKNTTSDIVMAKTEILNMSCDSIVENMNDIKVLFTQLQVIYGK